jgi:hypothetical protein
VGALDLAERLVFSCRRTHSRPEVTTPGVNSGVTLVKNPVRAGKSPQNGIREEHPRPPDGTLPEITTAFYGMRKRIRPR